MNNQPNPGNSSHNGGSGVVWLVVGLIPIPVLLVFWSPNQAHSAPFSLFVFLACALCNLLGGIGCLSAIKDVALRVILGLVIAGFLFVLSWGIALFQACSHMNI